MKYILNLACGLLLSTAIVAQPNVICEQHYLAQLSRLSQGVLIVELQASPFIKGGIVDVRSPEAKEIQVKQNEAKALFEAFNKEYSFSKVLFEYLDESGEKNLIDNVGNQVEAPTDSSKIFKASKVNNDSRIKGCQYEKKNSSGNWELQVEVEKKNKMSEYEQRLTAYDPENIENGGLEISPLMPEVTKLKKNKRASSKFRYKSKLNALTPVEARFRESVIYLDKKLKKEMREYSKKVG